VPSQPLLAGDTEGRVGVSFTTSNLAQFAVQGGVYWGLSDQDVLGLSFNSWVLPSRVSYARYFHTLDSGYWNGNVQAHIGSLLGGELNPVFELGAAVSYLDGNVDQTAKLGVGYFAPSWPSLFHPGPSSKRRIVPILAYQIYTKSVLAEVELIYGMSSQHMDSFLNKNNRIKSGLVIRHDDIKQIEQVGIQYSEAVWQVWLTNGDLITVSNRDPYSDCIGCSLDQKKLAAYLPSTDYRSLWIYRNHSESLQLLALNMYEILFHFENGGNLNLVQDNTIEDMICETVQSGREDIGVFVGYRGKGENW